MIFAEEKFFRYYDLSIANKKLEDYAKTEASYTLYAQS